MRKQQRQAFLRARPHGLSHKGVIAFMAIQAQLYAVNKDVTLTGPEKDKLFAEGAHLIASLR